MGCLAGLDPRGDHPHNPPFPHRMAASPIPSPSRPRARPTQGPKHSRFRPEISKGTWRLKRAQETHRRPLCPTQQPRCCVARTPPPKHASQPAETRKIHDAQVPVQPWLGKSALSGALGRSRDLLRRKRGVGTWHRTPGHGDPQCTDVDLPTRRLLTTCHPQKTLPAFPPPSRMTWCRVSPAGPSTKLTGVLGYLPSATSLVLCLEPTAVVRFALGPGSSCLCAPHGEQQPRGDTQHDNRIFNTQDKRHLFPSGLGQLVGHRSSHRSVPEASNYNKICLAQISAEDDASAAGSPSAGTQLHFFQPPTIQDTLPNGAARWAGRGAASSEGCGWFRHPFFNPHQIPKGCFPSRITGAVPSQAHWALSTVSMARPRVTVKR